MNLFRLLRAAGGLGLMMGGLTSCLNEPSFSDTPSITFNSIRRERFTINGSTVPIDSVYITVNFQDGDGDLGLTNTESITAPYGSASNPSRNYIATDFIKNTVTGRYDSARTVYTYLPKRNLYSTFDHLSTTTDNRSAPLRGTLTRSYGFYVGNPYLPNRTVRYRISIFDRAMRQSNEIVTDSIVIPPL